MRAYIDIVTGHFLSIWDSICTLCLFKVGIGSIIATFAYLFGTNNNQLLLALVVLVAFDFISAMGGAYKQGVPIESRRALKSASKLVVYGLFISAGHMTSLIVFDSSFIENSILAFLALTELISIMENIGKMGYVVPQVLLNQITDLRDKRTKKSV